MLPRDIIDEYAAARAKALAEAGGRRALAFARAPGLEGIERGCAELALSYARELAVAADKAAFREESRARMEALKAQKAKLLADSGMPADFYEPKYACAACADTGRLQGGGLCPCAREKLAGRKFASSGIAAGAAFEKFDPSVFRDAEQLRRSRRAMEICEQYASALAIGGARGLILMGDTGLGKTFLLDCIGRRAIEGGRTVEKYTAYNIVSMMLSSIRERRETKNLSRPDLLLIDDLGTEPMINGVTFEALYSAINERQNADKATVIATNLDKARILDTYGERLFSRLFAQRCFGLIELRGRDLRL